MTSTQVVQAVVNRGLRISPVPRYEPESIDSGSPDRQHFVPAGAERQRCVEPPKPESVSMQIRHFATGAIKLVLEVMDRRRPVSQLGRVALPHIADQFRVVLAASEHSRPPSASTVLRVHTQSSGDDAAEITVVYGRGDRVHAMGARVERRSVMVRAATPGGPRRREVRWMLVAITVG